MSIIKSKSLRVEINEIGSTLESFYDLSREKELLWQGSEDSWTGKDVTIFPFVARLKDGYYEVGGEKFEMPLHGLCVEREFDVVRLSESAVEHRFVYGADTLRYYPYKFDLRVIHEVAGDSYVKTMRVKNLGESDMYFALGGHPAVALPSTGDCDTSRNFINFPRTMRPNNYFLDGAGHFITRKGEFYSFDKLPCDKKIMEKYATLILTDEKFDKLSVVRSDGIEIEFLLNEPPVLAFWSHPQKGEYICVEPWWGVPDFVDPIRSIDRKELINKLSAGDTFEYSFSMNIKR